jgi:hypothetical protein
MEMIKKCLEKSLMGLLTTEEYYFTQNEWSGQEQKKWCLISSLMTSVPITRIGCSFGTMSMTQSVLLVTVTLSLDNSVSLSLEEGLSQRMMSSFMFMLEMRLDLSIIILMRFSGSLLNSSSTLQNLGRSHAQMTRESTLVE